MNVIVTGVDYFDDYDRLKFILDKVPAKSIVSLGHKGVDLLAQKYAQEKNINLFIRPDSSEDFGGDIDQRNYRVIRKADAAILFYDGKCDRTTDFLLALDEHDHTASLKGRTYVEAYGNLIDQETLDAIDF